MTEFRPVGRSIAPDRSLYLGRFAERESWPVGVAAALKPFVLFTAFDASALSEEELRAFARRLLDEGCVYSCSWGPDSTRVETAFDLVAVEADVAGDPYVGDVVMTTSHESESLDDALWFAVFTAFPPDVQARALLVVVEDGWAGDIESRLADSARWSAAVLSTDDQESA